MTLQVSGQQWYRKRGGKWRHVIFICFVIVSLLGVASIWLVNIGSVLSGVFSIVFTLLGVLLPFLQWQLRRPEAQEQASDFPINKQCQQRFYEQIEGVELEANKFKGALIVYTRKDLRGSAINLSFGFHSNILGVDLPSRVIDRKRKGSTIYVAVFSLLEPGNYTVHTDSQKFVTKVRIMPGKVEEVDWR